MRQGRALDDKGPGHGSLVWLVPFRLLNDIFTKCCTKK